MRRNRVLQALSWYRARVLGVNQWSPLALRRALEEAGYVADPQVLAWLLEFFDDANRRIENAAVFHGRPTLLVWHEDLLADPHSTICRVAAFLGLSGAFRVLEDVKVDRVYISPLSRLSMTLTCATSQMWTTLRRPNSSRRLRMRRPSTPWPT